MWQVGRDVDIEAPVVELVQRFRESFPVPWEALEHDHLGYILHAFHDGDEHVALVGLARGEANAAIPHENRRHTVVRRGGKSGFPRYLPIIMGVHVDRKSVVSGKSVSVRVDLGGRRIIKKKTK